MPMTVRPTIEGFSSIAAPALQDQLLGQDRDGEADDQQRGEGIGLVRVGEYVPGDELADGPPESTGGRDGEEEEATD